MYHPTRRTARRLCRPILLGFGCLLLGMAALPLAAQTVAPGVWNIDASDWTGSPQSPAIARKEAGAALAEGRRECARERDRSARTACLEQVQAEHARMMKQIAAMSARPGAEAKPAKPVKPAP